MGVSVGLVSLAVSVWVAAAIIDHFGRVERHLSSWTKLKGGFFLLFFLSCYGGFLYVEIVQV